MFSKLTDKHALNKSQVLHSDMSFGRPNLCIFHVLAKLARGDGLWGWRLARTRN